MAKKPVKIRLEYNGRKTFVECAEAGIFQNFLTEDIGNLILDLPNLIEKNNAGNKKTKN